MQLHQALENPGYAKAVQKTFDQAKAFAQNNAIAKAGGSQILRIPVVVHIVYNTSNQNIPDAGGFSTN
jgi:hypothetical protein